jgi:hypothetical protein
VVVVVPVRSSMRFVASDRALGPSDGTPAHFGPSGVRNCQPHALC